MLKITVEVYNKDGSFDLLLRYGMKYAEPIVRYEMDHDDKAQRRVLGEQCRNAFEGGQMIVTYPSPKKE